MFCHCAATDLKQLGHFVVIWVIYIFHLWFKIWKRAFLHCVVARCERRVVRKRWPSAFVIVVCNVLPFVSSLQVDNGYYIWSFQGKLLQRHALDQFCQLLWRPRPPSLLSEDDMKVEGPGGQSLYLVFVPKTLLPSCKSKLFRVHFLNKLEQRHRLFLVESLLVSPWAAILLVSAMDQGLRRSSYFPGFWLADSFKTDVLKFFLSNYQ